MSTFLPLDSNNNPIPALRLKDDGAHSIGVGSSSARNSTAFSADTRVIGLYATTDMYVRLGDGTVSASASDHFFPAGVYYDISIGGDAAALDTHIAAVRVSADGVLYISEKE